jgi:hypothetical protein
MTANNLLSNLTARGVRLWADSGRIKFDAPEGVLTDADREGLASLKRELLVILEHGDRNPLPMAVEACPTCRRSLETETSDSHLHIWCPAGGHFDSWTAAPGFKLGQTDVRIFKRKYED